MRCFTKIDIISLIVSNPVSSLFNLINNKFFVHEELQFLEFETLKAYQQIQLELHMLLLFIKIVSIKIIFGFNIINIKIFQFF